MTHARQATTTPSGATPLELDAPVIPAAYVKRWLGFLGARGIAPERVLERTDLTVDALGDPALLISQRTSAQAWFNGLALAGDPAIGLEFGLSLQPTAHGWVGIAIVTAASVRAALGVVDRFGLLRAGPWQFRWSEHGATASFQIDERVPLGPLRPLLFEIVLGAFCRFAEIIVGPGAVAEMAVAMADPVQPHHARFATRIPRLQQATRTEIQFPAAWLDHAMPLADPMAHREAIAVLDAEKAGLVSDDPVDRVRALLAAPRNRFPSLEDAARQLGVSSRSLRRHLRARGTEFQILRDDARHTHASTLLTSSMLTLDEIAAALGYTRTAAFVRAFRRWSGTSPIAYRHRMQQIGPRRLG